VRHLHRFVIDTTQHWPFEQHPNHPLLSPLYQRSVWQDTSLVVCRRCSSSRRCSNQWQPVQGYRLLSIHNHLFFLVFRLHYILHYQIPSVWVSIINRTYILIPTSAASDSARHRQQSITIVL
jgi:hypothetical protein